MYLNLFFLITAALSLASVAKAGTYSQCQASDSSLQGCPSGTKYVAAGTKIQTAIDSGAAYILIAPGTYNEQLKVSKNLVMLGSTKGTVTVTHSAYKDLSGSGANRDAATLYVSGSTFYAYDIVFANTADDKTTASQPLGPAAAVYFETNAKASLYNCQVKSWQDSLYAGGNFFMYKGSVWGWVDMLYGDGKSWFSGVTIYNRGCGGGITAWRGASGGAVIQEGGRVTIASDARSGTSGCYLGRPWDSKMKSSYLNTVMDSVVNLKGWSTWSSSDPRYTEGQTIFEEYNSSGAGYDASKRQLVKILTSNPYTIKGFFGDTSFIDSGTASI
ncbi:pectin lyase-like protein [Violaceomyces palustris]|uniref:Pectin lyase-like protein n=1 Tax=Violaceomyces palustris TaxID=1673888 RepID=A0ACD0NSA8_9BASI|nr:pectin lyase-like protein [Violaceomyces palustris]